MLFHVLPELLHILSKVLHGLPEPLCVYCMSYWACFVFYQPTACLARFAAGFSRTSADFSRVPAYFTRSPHFFFTFPLQVLPDWCMFSQVGAFFPRTLCPPSLQPLYLPGLGSAWPQLCLKQTRSLPVGSKLPNGRLCYSINFF